MVEPVKLVTPRQRYQEDIVKVLENALNDARAGKIMSVAIATVTTDRHGEYRWSEGDDAMALVGSIQRLLHRINVALDEDISEIEEDPTP